jgi:phenylpyruvate tautomerase PptA (4-oxalocrotonate tautomerase family)
MPLVRIDLAAGHSPEGLAAIARGVHDALVAAFAIPPDDRFAILTEHAASEMIHTSTYLGVTYTDGLTIVQITCNDGRTVEQKKALFAAIASNLAADPGVRPADVFVNLVEVRKENWSFGDGIAQYA